MWSCSPLLTCWYSVDAAAAIPMPPLPLLNTPPDPAGDTRRPAAVAGGTSRLPPPSMAAGDTERDKGREPPCRVAIVPMSAGLRNRPPSTCRCCHCCHPDRVLVLLLLVVLLVGLLLLLAAVLLRPLLTILCMAATGSATAQGCCGSRMKSLLLPLVLVPLPLLLLLMDCMTRCDAAVRLSVVLA